MTPAPGRAVSRSMRRCSPAARRSASSSAASASSPRAALPSAAVRPRWPSRCRTCARSSRRTVSGSPGECCRCADEEDQRLRGRPREPRVDDAFASMALPAPFLKRLTLEGSGDRAHWTLLAGEGTLFDLPDERLRQTRLPFPAGSVSLLARHLGRYQQRPRCRLPTTVRPASAGAGHAPPASDDVARPSNAVRASRVAAAIASACRPPACRSWRSISTSAPGHVFRQAIVSESRFAGTEAAPVELGRATLTRVIRDGLAADALRIPIATPSEADST